MLVHLCPKVKIFSHEVTLAQYFKALPSPNGPPVIAENGWHIPTSVLGTIVYVPIKFCPHCGTELPSACGCCEGTGIFKCMQEGADFPFEHVCEICFGSGEEQD